MLSLIRGEQGGVGGQFIGGYNNDGNRLWWMGSGGNGVRDVALYSDAWGMGVSITQNGINADGNLLERGARVYSPYNPQPSQTSASLASNGWWRDNGTGMIYQWVNGINLSSAGGSSENVPFPISFPLGCLSVNVSVKGAAAEQVGWDNATNSSVIIVKGAGDGVYSRIANVFVIGF
uniref:gp53-like domain-containing protein n=1 Tax=Serratia marcescens TaxID=615 RepID=UPI00356B7724